MGYEIDFLEMAMINEMLTEKGLPLSYPRCNDTTANVKYTPRRIEYDKERDGVYADAADLYGDI